MHLFQLFTQPLFEANILNMTMNDRFTNVLNASSVQRFIDDQISKMPHHSPQRKKAMAWFETKFKRFIAKYDGPALLPINPNFVLKTVQDDPSMAWVAREIEAGRPIYSFSIMKDPELIEKVDNIIDWLVHLANDNPREFYNKIDRYSFEQADKAQQEWHARMARTASNGVATTEGAVRIMQFGDYTWWELTDECALDGEGDVMGHCVGGPGYSRRVKNGSAKIFSLRDSKGKSHITIEAAYEKTRYTVGGSNERFVVEQVKCRGNAYPPPKYHAAIQALVDKMKMFWGKGSSDMNKGGAILVDQRYVPFEDVAEKVAEKDGYSIYAYARDARSVTQKESKIEGWARALKGNTLLISSRFSRADGLFSDQNPYFTSFTMNENIAIEDLVVAFPLMLKTLKEKYDARESKHTKGLGEIYDKIYKAGYVFIKSANRYGTQDELLKETRSELIKWASDPMNSDLNAYGTSDGYVRLIMAVKGIGLDEALTELKKILPKSRKTPKIKSIEEKRNYTFLYTDKRYGDYWFWDRETNRIIDVEPSDY